MPDTKTVILPFCESASSYMRFLNSPGSLSIGEACIVPVVETSDFQEVSDVNGSRMSTQLGEPAQFRMRTEYKLEK